MFETNHTTAQAEESHSDGWDTFLATTRPDIGFMQRSWWAKLLAGQDWGFFGAVFRDEGTVLGGARVLTRNFDDDHGFYYVPEGPVLPTDATDAAELYAAFIEFVRTKRQAAPYCVTHMRMEPRWIDLPAFLADCRQAKSWFEPRTTLMVDLQLTESELLAQMKPKGRYNIRLAERHGVVVRSDCTDGGVEEFLSLYGQTIERQRIRGEGSSYLRALCNRSVAAHSAEIFFAEHEGQRLATALVVYSGDRATYLFGGSSEKKRQVMATYALHFEAMKNARRRQCRWYDFYGISPPDGRFHKWDAITKFKRKFGGHEFNFVPSLDIVFDEKGYQRYRKRSSARLIRGQ